MMGSDDNSAKSPPISPAGTPVKSKAATAVQLTTAVVATVMMVGAARYALRALAAGSATMELKDVILSIGWRSVVTVTMVTVFFHIQKRSRLGQALGAVLIALLGIPVIAVLLTPSQAPDHPIEHLVGRYGALLSLLLMFCYWIYAFSFSPKARLYFTPKSKASSEIAIGDSGV